MGMGMGIGMGGVGMQVLKGVAGLAMGAGLMGMSRANSSATVKAPTVVAKPTAGKAMLGGLQLGWGSRLQIAGNEEESDDEDDE
ncbi:hypothetical protein RHS02_09017, partial [Rhizoctonia solani]